MDSALILIFIMTSMINNYMTVLEVARLAKVSSEVVRYYSRLGLIKPTRNRTNGYKLYSSKDVSKIIFIRQAKCLGCSLNEIKNILSHAIAGKAPCPVVGQIIEKRLSENNKRILSVLKFQEKMEKTVQIWKSMPNGIPNNENICAFIESLTVDEITN